MAGVKISNLPPIPVAPLLNDIFPEVQPAAGGTTYKSTFQQLLTLYQDSATYFTGLTGPLEAPTAVNDANGNQILTFNSVGSAVNNIRIINSATGIGPGISTIGSDTDIALTVGTKGNGNISLVTASVAQPLLVYSGTSNQHLTRFVMANTAADRSVTFQDSSGTLAYLSDIPSLPLSIANGGTGQTTVNGIKSTLNNCAFDARAILQSNVTGDGTNYGAIFDTVVGDVGGNYNNISGAFTVPTTGFYQISSNIAISGLLAAHTAATIYIVASDGSSIGIFYGNPFAVSTGGILQFTASSCLKFNSGVIVTVIVNVSGGAKVVNVLAGSLFNGFFLG